MNDALIKKLYELHPEKKEPPKMPSIEDYEGEETIADELKKSKLITYDPDSVNVSFHQVAEKLKTGNAQVVSMYMERDIMSGTKITFDVMVYES